MKPQIVPDLDSAVTASRFSNQGLNSARLVRERLFDKNVGIGTEGGECLFHVVYRGSADECQIRLEVLERFAVVAEEFSFKFFAAFFNNFPVSVAKSKLLHAERHKISRMPSANRTATDHKSSVFYPLGNTGHANALIA